MKNPKILLFFEYGTLNGGEMSMLAMLEVLGQTDFEFVAAAPASGMLSSMAGISSQSDGSLEALRRTCPLSHME